LCAAAIIYCVLTLAATPVRAADDAAIPLTGPIATADLVPHVEAYLDPDWSRTVEDMAGADAGLFRKLPRDVVDFGYTKAMIWLRFRLRNATADQSRWVIYFRENFKQVFQVHVIHADGRIETPLRQDVSTGFGTRPIAYPELASPLRIQPGETATVLVRYWSEGASYLPLQIETPTSFSAIAAKRTGKNFLYYGMILLLIVGALVALAIFRRTVFLAYVAYTTSMLVFVMHADGVAFQYLWPGFPGFNSVASMVAGSGLIIFGAIYARVFLKTAELHPIVDKMLLAVILVTLAVDATALVYDTQQIKRFLVLLSLIALVSFTVAGGVAARKRFKEVRFFVLAWSGAVLSALLMTLRHWLGIEVSQDFQYDSMRVVMVFDASMMGLAIVDGYNQLRASRQAALAAGLQQARQNLELSGRLQDLERQVSLADELARSQGLALKDTMHDLRQPLNALRLRIHGVLNAGQDPEASRPDIENAFRYLENLVNERLADGEGALAAAAAQAGQDDDAIGLNDILSSIHQMFLPDAAAKGLRFRLAPTSAEVAAPPLRLMRVVSNLVANAIKYTEAGGVLIGTRRRRGRIDIEIHDTGPGMSAADFERALGRAVRLDANPGFAEGHGLGLAIACQIAAAEGWTITRDRRRKTGFGIAVSLPAHVRRRRARTLPAPQTNV